MWKLVALLFCLSLTARAQPRDDLLAFAAASLTEAMHDAARLWESNGNPRIRFNFAASAALARQLDQGAPAHLFAAADLAWMDWAQSRSLIVRETRRTLLGNRLVLIAPTDRTPPAITPAFDLLPLLGPSGRLAIGDPASVPAGTYAKQALTTLGIWPALQPRLARAESVRAALLLVERGEAPLGIVFATDATTARNIAVLATLPPTTHDRIAYPFAIPRAGDTPAARRFLAFLAGPQATELFSRRGFVTE